MSTLKLKVLLIIVEELEKAKLFKNIIKNRFQADYRLSTGVDILTKDIEFMQGKIATLSIWDIKSQQRFEFIHSTFYKGAAGAIFVFDLTREETYIEVKKKFTEIRQFAGDIPFVLMGDNIHLFQTKDKPFIRKEAREFAKNKGGIYIEISPINNDIIESILQNLTLLAVKKFLS